MTYLKNCICLLLLLPMYQLSSAQYTETINTNRPGQSQGAFAPGKNVIQIETGGLIGDEEHNLLNTESSLWGIDATVRYGFLMETLEVLFSTTYISEDIDQIQGDNSVPFDRSGFPSLSLGAKYLVYDPYKVEEEVNIYSYHANRRFKWRSLIPAVAVYAGANYIYSDNPFVTTDLEGFSPRAAIITQNNWGAWVWVNNFSGDFIGTDFPSYAWISTMTRSLTPRLAGFLEVQVIKSDLYADDILRGGAAYLVSKNLQVDVSALTNFKDTPSRFNIAFGIAYRYDGMHADKRFDDDDEAPNYQEREARRKSRYGGGN
ncbi:transporter [Croceiramulus getboli]|nr:transporter [Flavobacteriaceae bacterium YJPT1-3]